MLKQSELVNLAIIDDRIKLIATLIDVVLVLL